MNVESITIIGGQGKDGRPEGVGRVELRMGDIVSVVGPTGCGKTTLINDIEMCADRNTPSQRRILINDRPVPQTWAWERAAHPIALISQHTNFLSDLPVAEFLAIHAAVRRSGNLEDIVEQTIAFANQLTGEPLILDSPMTELSGGQTRALLIADAVVIGHSPIILLDEIENAGIHRIRALELLRGYRKIFIFVTHDPRIALLSDRRIVMRRGAMGDVIATSPEEQRVALEIGRLDDLLLELRGRIREGQRLTERMVAERLRTDAHACAA